MKRILTAVLFMAMLVVGLAGCDSTGENTETDTPEAVDVECIYTIVRGDNCSKEETDGAVRLRNTLEEYGIQAVLVTDWVNRGENVEEHRYPNEILFGDTNRAESEAAVAALNNGARGMVNYSVSSDGEDYILAACPGYVDKAVDVLLSVFTEDLTRLGSAPVEVDVREEHSFPMEDITICGVSVEEFEYILYENSYKDAMIDDIQKLSDLIFDACGTRIPLEREAPIYTGRSIRIGEGLDAEVQAGGSFSYGVIPTADGLIVEGKDVWNDWAALDALITEIENAIPGGGVLAIDEPIRRITDPAEDEPDSQLILAAWTISAPHMTEEYQVAEIAECGYNQIIIVKPDDDTQFHNLAKWMAKYELRGLWYHWSMALEQWQADNKEFRDLEAEYMDTSVVWGHLIKDEPNVTMYEDLKTMKDIYMAAHPGKVAYVNLFPNYANADQMKVETYQEYVDRFFEVFQPEYASVDIYPLNVGNKIINGYFENLDVFSTACRENKVPFGVYIQTVSFAASKRTPVEQEMRWQAYNALAFGATNIEYFTYRTPDSSTEEFKNALIARDNTKTERWYGAQQVNGELAAMGEAFLQYDHLGCWGVNMQNAPSYFQFDNQYADFDAIGKVTVTDDKTLLMGGFAAKEGDGKAFICVNTADPGTGAADIQVTMQLENGYTGAVLYQMGEKSALQPDANGCIGFTLACGEGVFVELTR
ncbi:MAG: beta-galactosidase [Clostridia bacterium]|nr:beta-galactosidase [Clostridia bacterium]